MESAFPSNSSHFELLARLLDHAGEVVTRGALRRELWPGDTFVDFEHGLNVAIARVREALGDEADHPRFVETLPKRGYRFIAPVERTTPCAPRRKGHAMAWVALAIGLGGVAAIGVVQMRRQPVLTDRDTILVADFVNKTGDEVFNDTLRQALTVDLEQSPFLSVVSHERVRETLKQMTRSAEERVVGTVAREVCQRVGAGASVSGSIAALGTHFVLDIDAVSCASGNTVAHAQQEALGREQVIKALGAAATRLRPRLGESQASLRQFDLPLEQATTPSLEALKAFSLGVATRARVSEAKAIPFFRRAIELDPDFAMAHAILGTIYSNVGPYDEAIRYTRSAYERRNRATDRERFYIEAHACEFIVVEPDCYLNAHEVWKRTYPRDWRPYTNLANEYAWRGQFDLAIENGREAVKLNPAVVFPYIRLAEAYMATNQFDEADRTTAAAVAHDVARIEIHQLRFQLAFLRADHAAMDVERKAFTVEGDDYVAEWDSKIAASQASARLESTIDGYHWRQPLIALVSG